MPFRALALILAAILLSGCSTTSRIFQRVPTEPVVIYVEVEKYIPLPEEHLKPCLYVRAKDRSVKEYVRVANTNTPALMQCAKQLEAIRKLQP